MQDKTKHCCYKNELFKVSGNGVIVAISIDRFSVYSMEYGIEFKKYFFQRNCGIKLLLLNMKFLPLCNMKFPSLYNMELFSEVKRDYIFPKTIKPGELFLACSLFGNGMLCSFDWKDKYYMHSFLKFVFKTIFMQIYSYCFFPTELTVGANHSSIMVYFSDQSVVMTYWNILAHITRDPAWYWQLQEV